MIKRDNDERYDMLYWPSFSNDNILREESIMQAKQLEAI